MTQKFKLQIEELAFGSCQSLGTSNYEIICLPHNLDKLGTEVFKYKSNICQFNKCIWIPQKDIEEIFDTEQLSIFQKLEILILPPTIPSVKPAAPQLISAADFPPLSAVDSPAVAVADSPAGSEAGPLGSGGNKKSKRLLKSFQKKSTTKRKR